MPIRLPDSLSELFSELFSELLVGSRMAKLYSPYSNLADGYAKTDLSKDAMMSEMPDVDGVSGLSGSRDRHGATDKDLDATAVRPMIMLAGNAREAMAFYQQCIGGDLDISCYRDGPDADGVPAVLLDQVSFAILEKGNFVLLAMDILPEYLVTARSGITLWLSCCSEDESARVFDALCVGGNIAEPLHLTWWRTCCGRVVDRFGVEWIVESPIAVGAMDAKTATGIALPRSKAAI